MRFESFEKNLLNSAVKRFIGIDARLKCFAKVHSLCVGSRNRLKIRLHADMVSFIKQGYKILGNNLRPNSLKKRDRGIDGTWEHSVNDGNLLIERVRDIVEER